MRFPSLLVLVLATFQSSSFLASAQVITHVPSTEARKFRAHAAELKITLGETKINTSALLLRNGGLPERADLKNRLAGVYDSQIQWLEQEKKLPLYSRHNIYHAPHFDLNEPKGTLADFLMTDWELDRLISELKVKKMICEMDALDFDRRQALVDRLVNRNDAKALKLENQIIDLETLAAHSYAGRP